MLLLHCFHISLNLMHKQEKDEEMMQNEKQPEHEHSEETKNNKKMMTKMKQESKKGVNSYACDSIDIQSKMDHDKDLFLNDDDDSGMKTTDPNSSVYHSLMTVEQMMTKNLTNEYRL